MSRNRIKSRDTDKNTIGKSSSLDSYPLFCFKYLQDASLKGCVDHKFYFEFLFRLKKLSELGWKGINISGRHSFGTEKMPIDKIKPDLPSIITEDVNELTVFRATGSNLPFLGIQKQDKFHVLFIETNFGDIYNH